MIDLAHECPPRILDSFFVGGHWVRASGSERKKIVSPADRMTLADVPMCR